MRRGGSPTPALSRHCGPGSPAGLDDRDDRAEEYSPVSEREKDPENDRVNVAVDDHGDCDDETRGSCDPAGGEGSPVAGEPGGIGGLG